MSSAREDADALVVSVAWLAIAAFETEISKLKAENAKLKAEIEQRADHESYLSQEFANTYYEKNARIAELEAERRWIPVSERLPEENQQILSTDGKEFYLDYYARWEGKDNPPCFCDGLSWAVTHWMPLPEPPEAEE